MYFRFKRKEVNGDTAVPSLWSSSRRLLCLEGDPRSGSLGWGAPPPPVLGRHIVHPIRGRSSA